MRTLSSFFRYWNTRPWWAAMTPLFFIGLVFFLAPHLSLWVRVLCLLSFFVPLLFRNELGEVFYKPSARQVVRASCVVFMIVAVVGVSYLDRTLYSILAISFLSTLFGYQVVIENGEHAEMVRWLSSPFEYGEIPQSLRLVHSESVGWNDLEETCYVFEYVFDGEKAYSITGPITFSTGETIEAGQSYTDIVKKYERWYVNEGVQEL